VDDDSYTLTYISVSAERRNLLVSLISFLFVSPLRSGMAQVKFSAFLYFAPEYDLSGVSKLQRNGELASAIGRN